MGFFREFLGIQAEKIGLGLRRSPGPRIDDKLPLSMRIGGYVRFDQTPFIISKRAGLLVEPPSSRLIAAYGKIKFEGFIIHRAYLQDGDREVDHFLQVVTKPDGKIDGAPRLFRLHEELMPGSVDEWSVWLPDPKKPKQSYLIGFESFGLHDKEGKVLADYRRMWPNPNDINPQVEPRELSETLYTSPQEGSSVRVRHQAMLYGRKPARPEGFPANAVIPEEWVLLSASDYPGTAMAQIHVGLDLEPRHFTVTPPAEAAA